MKKRYLLVVIIIVFGVFVWLLLRATNSLQTPVVNPVGTNTALEPTPAAETTSTSATEKSDIILTSPTEKQSVASPIIIAGSARGNWYFEGTFPVTLTNWDGLIIAQGKAKAQGSWMTNDFVPFTATLKYTLPAGTPYKRGFLILKNDNPSGDPSRDRSMEIEVELQ